MRTYSVGEITRYIHELLDADAVLGSLRVRGEVSNLTRAASGHWYFTLKDRAAQMRCVMFRSAARFVSVDIGVGDEVIVSGRVSVYEARGEYQLYAEHIEAVGGVGDLHAQFELLKARLDAEGLFDAERKRAIPAFPKRIGVVTSASAAAWQDIQHVLRRRFPLLELILSPTLVQGDEAPSRIVAALDKLNQIDDIDLVIVARGGGSLEDLWAFNDEAVARAIAASRAPIISGVGHEIDFTIADFVADLRAPTPSAAAELATPTIDDLLLDLDRLGASLDGLLEAHLRLRVNQMDLARRGLDFASPRRRLDLARERLGRLGERLEREAAARLFRFRESLQSRQKLLDAADPERTLARGYAIVSDESGSLIRSANQVAVNQRLAVRFHRDQINVRVES